MFKGIRSEYCSLTVKGDLTLAPLAESQSQSSAQAADSVKTESTNMQVEESQPVAQMATELPILDEQGMQREFPIVIPGCIANLYNEAADSMPDPPPPTSTPSGEKTVVEQEPTKTLLKSEDETKMDVENNVPLQVGLGLTPETVGNTDIKITYAADWPDERQLSEALRITRQYG